MQNRTKNIGPPPGGQGDSPAGEQSPPAHDLSHRQREFAALLHRGLTDQEIARALGLSYHTVRTHLRSSLRKLGPHPPPRPPRPPSRPPPPTKPPFSR